jgi:hypothetical protein
MLIFYPRTTDSSEVTPLVLIDALCSDDRFGTKEIAALVKQCAPQVTPPLKLTPQYKIFSTEYEWTYTRNNTPPEASIKSDFTGVIKSPPAEFVTAFSPAWFLSAQNIDDMDNAAARVANAQTAYVYASAVARNADGTNLVLDFVAYRAESVPDPFGVSTTLILRGALVDDVIIQTNSAFTLDTKTSLKTQLDTLLSSFGYAGDYKIASLTANPVSSKLFPPQTLNGILGGICYQNKLLFYIDYAAKIVRFYSQGLAGTPKNAGLGTLQTLSFLGAGGRLILSNFTVSDFSQAHFSTQFFPVQPFDSLLLVNDAKSGVFEGATVAQKAGKFNVYLYYVMAFSYRWSREMYDLQISASNNWLMTTNKIGDLLATGVYAANAARVK